jgi:hypothetical protein
MASHAAMIEAAKKIPGLRKRWLRSGKKHPRRSHYRAHNQMVLAAEPFVIGGVKLMHPRDPNGPADHTINCGCMAVPVVDGSTLGASQVRIDPAEPMRDPDIVRRPEPTAAEIAGAVLPTVASIAPAAAAALAVSPVTSGLSDALVDAVTAFEAAAARSPVERLAFFSADGRLLREVTGSEDRARFEMPLRDGLAGVLTHTHSGNTAPGYQDLLTAAAYEVQELRVVGPRDLFRLGPFDRLTFAALLRERHSLAVEFEAVVSDVRARFPRMSAERQFQLAYNQFGPIAARRLGIPYRRLRHDY